MKNKIKNTVLSTGSKIALKGSMAATLIPAACLVAKCGGGGGGELKKLVLAIADVVVKIFPFIGIFFILSGVFKLIQAYRTDQPENQATAAKDIVIGAVFVVFKAFVWDAIKDAIPSF